MIVKQSSKQDLAGTAAQSRQDGHYALQVDEGDVLAGSLLLTFQGPDPALEPLRIAIAIDPGTVWACASIPPLSKFQEALGEQVTRVEISRDIAYAAKHLCGGIELKWQDDAYCFIVPVGSKLPGDYRPKRQES